MFDPAACAYDVPCAQCLHPVCANYGQSPNPTGFQGFSCEANGSPVSPANCLACARAGAKPGCHFTAPVVNGILHGLRADDAAPTVTTLLGCARKRRLMQTEPYWLKLGEAWWAFRGQLLHGVSAAYTKDDVNAIAETRFSMLIGEHTLTGQPDLVLADRRHLVDYKTTRAVPSAWRTWTCPITNQVIRAGAFAVRTKWLDCPYCQWCKTHKCAAALDATTCAVHDGTACVFVAGQHETKPIETHGPPRAYLRHVQQVSLYRLLLWENGIEVDSAEIIYQDMREQLRVPVMLLPLTEAHALLEARLALHHQSTLPDVLRDPAEQWECGFCPVRAHCERLHGAPVGKDLDDGANA